MRLSTKRVGVLALALLLCVSGTANTKHPRPRILGIDRVQIYVTNISTAKSFYRTFANDLCSQQEAEPANGPSYRMTGWCEDLPENTLFVGTSQTIGLSVSPNPAPSSLLAVITFATDNVAELRRYLKARGITASKPQKPDLYLIVSDPEGHSIGFAQRYNLAPTVPVPPDPRRLIHAGFVVHDRAAADRFYKDILGFHIYWHGGMKKGEDNWVDMQVPDGTDWIEYMLNVPANADHHTLGVMNHIALGVPDIHAAEEQLRKNGWTGTEQPKIGRDGKWQLNLYDPDDTRVEFMEFTPTQKPCCSEYTGPHPKP
jgi:catechol 2,3-dioxygenase-like lactoylglutathione lyase family enzyme